MFSGPQSCKFAPSTLALSALLLAFSALRIDCSRWLSECIPDDCLKQDDNTVFSHEKLSMLDVDKCLEEMQQALTIHLKQDQSLSSGSPSTDQMRPRVVSNSPVSVTASDVTSTRDMKANRLVTNTLNKQKNLTPKLMENNPSDEELFTVMHCTEYSSDVMCNNVAADISNDVSSGPSKKSRILHHEY